jgi:hypothetical protein
MLNKGPNVPKKEGTERWLYELLRKQGLNSQQAAISIEALGRGEQPDGSGLPLPTLDDYLYKPGRVGGQTAFGGKNASEILVFSSTKDSRKGSIWLTEDGDIIIDEDNKRVGIGETSPDAKLHITIGAPPFTYVRPDPANPTSVSGDWSIVGVGTDPGAVLDDLVDGTGADSDYIHEEYVGFGSPTLIKFQTITGPVPDTGVFFNIRARGTSTGALPNSYIFLDFSNSTGGILFSRRMGCPGYSASPATDFDVTGTFTTYSIALTGAECAALSDTGTYKINCSFTGGGIFWAGTFDISMMYFSFSTGGAGADVLQKWEYPSGSNLLEYADDSNAQKTLQLSGTPPLRLTTAPEFDVGTPTVGWVWDAADTEGTGVWYDPALLRTREFHRWAANGPYIVDTSVDGAWIVPSTVTITKIKLWRRTAGTSGTTTVAILLNGASQSTLSVTTANGPNFTSSATVSIACVENDKITIDCTSAETGTPLDYTFIAYGA